MPWQPHGRCLATVLIAICVLLLKLTLAAEAPELPERDDDGVPKVAVGGDRVVLDQLGPTIVTKDGRLKRIQDWETLGPQEQQKVHDILPARNKARLEALREQIRQEDLHDTTLQDTTKSATQGAQKTEAEVLREREASLNAFREKLAAFQAVSGGAPGLEGLDGLLKGADDRQPSAEDERKLREQLDKLKKQAERLQGGAPFKVREDL